jgi:hypothetical protein
MPVPCPIEKVIRIFPPVSRARLYDKLCRLPLGIACLGEAESSLPDLLRVVGQAISRRFSRLLRW